VGLRGAKYCYSTFNNVGMANVVDSLMAIEKIVFEDKRVTLPELAEILRNNFEGQDLLRAYATHKCQKFGNDLDAPDALMKELVDFACTRQNATPNSRGAHFNAGMYSVDHHARMGTRTGASADGRHAKDPLADGGVSAMYGRDVSGPTALLQSVAKLPFEKASNGTLLNMKFLPQFFKTDAGIQKFTELLRAFGRLGISHVQFNVLNEADLRAAQERPEEYRSLTVRVAGYTAYFTELARDLQDEIIARTTYESARQAQSLI